ncbi:MAG: glycoside hydrolase family 99-like domain-containing protein, partial [Methylovulum sp.]|nr:glycoside hydrolase family 99-like domain-containing protein [Methylovulum sp.]
PVNAGFYFKWQNAKLPAWVKKEDGKHKAKLSFFFENTDYQLEALQPLPLIKDLRVWVDISEPAKLSGSQKKAVIDAFENQKIEFETITDDQVKAIAFYLPQFHPIPENDEWWGAGFTEWNNVAQGKSYFSGHYQPHVPADLGYYDLRLPEVRETQAELAKKYGIYGFCYYYYWFAGRRILERPLQEVLESGKPDFPFCICWANENWSRRWDGSEQDILLEQIHSPENDAKFIHDVIPILKDPRYIRVKGKPLLMIYRISLLPNPSETTRLWRKICQDEGLGDIYLCAAEAFGYTNPEKDGFDATVQFPPHGVRVATSVNSLVDDLPEDYNGVLYDYQEVVFNELNREIPAYKRFRGVMCSWDNTARKKKSGNIFVNATPENYEVWIHAAVDYTRNYLPEGERLVFINAWNEWAEGTHLEPDRKFGHGFLEATQRALGEHTDWRVLLDIAEKKQTFTPVEVHDWVKQLRTHLINYQQSLRYLAKIHKPLQRDMANRAVFVSAELLAMDEKNLREASGEGNIEQIGAANTTFGFTKLLVDRQHTLYVHGWAVAKNCNINEYAPSCLTLIRKSDFKQYFALATIRYKRPDIGQIKPEYKETECAASGFKAYLDLNNVEQGEYRLGMVYLDSVLNHIGVLSYSVTYFKGELTIV